MIEISIIYVNYFSSEEIAESISSFKGGLSEISHEIIIADNSADQDEFERLKRIRSLWDVRLIQMPKNLGFGRGCNEGAKLARGKHLFFLNPDTRFLKGDIDSLLSFCDKNVKCGIAAPILFNNDMSMQYSARRFPTIFNQLFGRNALMTKFLKNNRFSSDYMYMKADYSTVLQVDWVRAAAIIIRRDLFLRIGGFSHDYFMFAEDIDICKKLNEIGYFTYIIPSLSLIHKLGTTVDKFPVRKIWMHHKSLYIYFSKRLTILKGMLFIVTIIRTVILTLMEELN